MEKEREPGKRRKKAEKGEGGGGGGSTKLRKAREAADVDDKFGCCTVLYLGRTHSLLQRLSQSASVFWGMQGGAGRRGRGEKGEGGEQK